MSTMYFIDDFFRFSCLHHCVYFFLDIEIYYWIKYQQLAGHGGFHEFRICNADGVEDPQNDCFEGNVLRDITGRTRIPHENIWRPLSPLRNVNGSNYRAVPTFSSGFVFGWDIQLPGNIKNCISFFKLI